MRNIELKRLLITIAGVVQGVGFRPFVYRLAAGSSLTGFVRNSSGVVEIEAQGEERNLERFLRQLQSDVPRGATISKLNSSERTCIEERGFRILSSEQSSPVGSQFAADFSICNECLLELEDPSNRRYRYPFINCASCGPRFSIIEDLPYDRVRTTMRKFQMCAECTAEYINPADRRFHAQAISCFSCGPTLTYLCDAAEAGKSNSRVSNALEAAIVALKGNAILAVKGLAGFHLMCRLNEQTIDKLRERKHRDRKPFAVLMKNTEMASKYFDLSQMGADLLQSAAAPIVLMKPLSQNSFPHNIAPGLTHIGVIFPSTPVQHLLLSGVNEPLLCTSANISDEPISISIETALHKLTDVADGFLDNDRDISARYDDSVLKPVTGGTSIIRRSRGIAPVPLGISTQSKQEVLAFGAFLKSAFCYVRGNDAYLSQHIGDLDNLEAEEFFLESLEAYAKLFRLTPSLVACDLHPDYLSTHLAARYSEEKKLPLVHVQHHHAHIVAIMAEHGLREPCLGVALDGTGYGLDGTIWGGEFLKVQYDSFERLGHFEYAPMSGAESAIKNPWRMTLGYISNLSGEEQAEFGAAIEDLLADFGISTVNLVKQQLQAKFNSPLTSSCGRLFDAVSALLGVCKQASYEGQAAAELEAIALPRFEGSGSLEKFLDESYPVDICNEETVLIQSSRILSCVNNDLKRGIDTCTVAARFHATIARLVYQTVATLSARTNINRVCFGGGVFQNELLIRLLRHQFNKSELSIYFASKAPSNDGGIALGQAMVALAKCGQLEI